MPQSDDDHAEILALIHANRIAIWTQDFAAYERCFVHAPYTTRWGWWRSGGIFVRHGWDEIASRVREQFNKPEFNIPANAYDTTVENLQIRVGGDMAWATFDQIYPSKPIPGDVGPGLTREVRFFERIDGRWRIAFLGFLDNDSGRGDAAILRLDPDGKVLWQSPAAIAAMGDDDDLVIRNGRLRIRDSRSDQKLQAAIGWAGQLDQGVMSRHGAMPILIEAGEGLPTRICWVIADGGMILFSLGEPELSQNRLDMAAVIYGLSPAQKRLAGQVIEGRTLNEIAALMGISVATARTHLQRIFDKTGIHNQPALVRVLLSVSAPV